MIRLEVHISTQTETYIGRIAVRQRVVIIWGRLGAVHLLYSSPTENVVEDDSVGFTRFGPGDVHSPGCSVLLGVNTVQWDVVRSSYTGGKMQGFNQIISEELPVGLAWPRVYPNLTLHGN